jgi:hypothetical protein
MTVVHAIVNAANLYCAVWTMVTCVALLTGHLHWGKK